MSSVAYLIPTFEPDEKLLVLLQSLLTKTTDIVFVVNDGSSNTNIYKDDLFSNNRVVLINHPVNMGKGAALKSGFKEILLHHPSVKACVTLDGDGQHCVEDAQGVANETVASGLLVLGVRDFNDKENAIPFRSRIGNTLTRWVWRLATGQYITDTQTGLRGLVPKFMEECLAIEANRYEFEMEMLLLAKKRGVQIVQIPIKTIYIDDNSSSHFNPIADSAKIYFSLFRFVLSSLTSFLVDYLVFFGLLFFGLLAPNTAFVAARLTSFFFNYTVNKKLVFKNKDKAILSFSRYILLFLVNLFLGYFVLKYLAVSKTSAILIKITVDIILFFFNFFVQREWVFPEGAGPGRQ